MMRNAVRVISLLLLMTISAGLLTACAGNPLRRRAQQTAAAQQSAGPTASPVQADPTRAAPTLAPTTEQPQATETAAPSEPTATWQPTVVDDTTGQNLDSLLDQLSTANAAGDTLEDVE
jgi:hypothetical protein